MRGSGWLARGGAAGRCTWALDGGTLILTPDGRAPEALAVRELQGIGGGDFEIALAVDGAATTLSRLGADGPPLRGALTRTWLPLRTQALRLTGAGDAVPFSGAIALGGDARRFAALLFDDLLAFATPGDDVAPLFLGLVSDITFDEAAYAVKVSGWDGAVAVFSKLAGRTEAFVRALEERRAALSAEASSALAAHLPTVPLAPRAALSAAWTPGRVMALGQLEASAAGLTKALASSWLRMLPRRREADGLLGWAENEKKFLGYTRPGTDTVPRSPQPGDPDAAPETAADPVAQTSPTVPEDPTAPLWLLVGRGGSWLLECLSLGDHATYRFSAGDEMPGLAAQLLCAPQFSREALYEPLAALVGERAEFGPAARDLPFLRALRERFAGRINHSGLAAWTKAIASVP
jgi:hypothetical protein